MSKFIVIDGLDGSGKGTQIGLIRKAYDPNRVSISREPGGTPRAERIREIILSTDLQSASPLTDLLMFFAARSDHVDTFIQPTLLGGVHVICDRYDSSSFAFQLVAEMNLQELDATFSFLRQRVVENIGEPDAYIFLDLPAEVAYERCRKAGEAKNTPFDVKPIEYHQRVREGFKMFATRHGDRSAMFFVNANRPVEAVQADLRQIIGTVFALDAS